MNKDFVEQLNELKLTNEERQLIRKINKNLSSLQDETTRFLNTDNDFIDATDLKTIFYSEKNNETILSKYKEIMNELKAGVEKIIIRSKEEVEIEKINVDLELPIVTYKITNTLQNLSRLFLKATKIEIVTKISELQIIEDENKKEYYKNKLNNLYEEIELVIRQSDFVEIDSLERDLNYVKNIETQKYKKNFSIIEISTIVLFTLFAFIFLILAITFTIMKL